MAYTNLLFLFFCLICAAQVIQGVQASRKQGMLPYQQRELSLQGSSQGWNNYRNPRTSMIGSVKPTCTYNECRGCRYKCRAEQVPVEGNDPINSAYHYKCVCHRVSLCEYACRYPKKHFEEFVMMDPSWVPSRH